MPINHEIYVHTISYANNPVEWLYKLRPGSYPHFPTFSFLPSGFSYELFLATVKATSMIVSGCSDLGLFDLNVLQDLRLRI